MVLVCAAVCLEAQVSFDRILRAADEPQNWLTHSGTVMSQRYSPLTQITPENVRNLELRWVFQAQSLEKFEATPLVVDGVMYTVQAQNLTNHANYLGYSGTLTSPFFGRPTTVSGMRKVDAGIAMNF